MFYYPSDTKAWNMHVQDSSKEIQLFMTVRAMSLPKLYDEGWDILDFTFWMDVIQHLKGLNFQPQEKIPLVNNTAAQIKVLEIKVHVCKISWTK